MKPCFFAFSIVLCLFLGYEAKAAAPYVDNREISNFTRHQNQLNSMGVNAALAKGITGKGVQIGIVDSGILFDKKSPFFNNLRGFPTEANYSELSLPPGVLQPHGNYEGFSNGLDDYAFAFKTELLGGYHGTLVSQVASMMAPQANIYDYKALDYNGNASQSDINEAIVDAVKYADVVNLSYGGSTTTSSELLTIFNALKRVKSDGSLNRGTLNALTYQKQRQTKDIPSVSVPSLALVWDRRFPVYVPWEGRQRLWLRSRVHQSLNQGLITYNDILDPSLIVNTQVAGLLPSEAEAALGKTTPELLKRNVSVKYQGKWQRWQWFKAQRFINIGDLTYNDIDPRDIVFVNEKTSPELVQAGVIPVTYQGSLVQWSWEQTQQALNDGIITYDNIAPRHVTRPTSLQRSLIAPVYSDLPVLVAAAGNDGGLNISLNPTYPAAFAKDYDGELIVAVALAGSGPAYARASYSNYCGADVAHACLSAPGTWSYQYNNGTVEDKSGTSFAAPAITGAVASVMSAFPNMTRQQVVELLFRTANQSVIPDFTTKGVKTVTFSDGTSGQASYEYGYGLVDLEAAFQPVGQTSILTASGSSVRFPSFTTSSAFGNSVSATGTFGFVDTYQRPFGADAQAVVKSLAKPQDLMDDDERMMLFDNVLSAQPGFSGEGGEPQTGWKSVSAFRQEMDLGVDSTKVGLSLEDMRGYKGGSLSPVTALTNASVDNSVSGLSLAPTAMENQDMRRFGVDVDLGYDTKMLLSSGFSESAFAQTQESVLAGNDAKSFAQDVEIRHNVTDHSWLSLTTGIMNETDTVLGSYFSGSADASGSQTTYNIVSGGLGLTDHTTVVGAFGYASTNVDQSADMAFDSLKSTNLTLGLVNRDLMNQGDTLTVSYREPLRVTQGSGYLSQATGYDTTNGGYTFANQRYDLSAEGREQTVEMGYTMQPELVGSSDALGLVVGYSKDYGNVAGEDNTYTMARYAFKF